MKPPLSHVYPRLMILLLWVGFAGSFDVDAATVFTDKPDYHPGQHVVISGRGWQAGEKVSLKLEEQPHPLLLTHQWTARADAQGRLLDSSFVINRSHLGVSFILTATGQSSAVVARTNFTD